MTSIYTKRDAIEAFCIGLLIDAVLPLPFCLIKELKDYTIIVLMLVIVQLLFSIGLLIFRNSDLSEQNYNFLKYGFTGIVCYEAYRHWL